VIALTNQGKNISLLAQLLDDATHRLVTDTDISTWNSKEPGLGNPLVDGYVLSSTIAGVRSWVVQSGGGSPLPPDAAGWLHDDGVGGLSWSTPSKSDVGLGSVEDTALSTWAGSANLTTLGTITTGVWNGTAIGDTYISSAATWNAKQDALGFTPENVANKATDFSTVNDTLYPSVAAVKTYADGLVAGLLDDRGSYDASVNVWPSSGGSGTAGAILKGDLWYISVAGTLGGVDVSVGSSIRALIDTPGQTAANWDILNVGLGYVPENVSNKVTSISGASTDTQYPSAKLLYTEVTGLQPLATNLTSLAGLTYVSASFVKMTAAGTFTLDTNAYLTSLSGAVLTDQTTPQTIGTTGDRLAMLWATDITVTNAISGSVTGNAGTVTNATFTTSFTNNGGAGVLTWPATGATLTIPTGGGTLGSAAFTDSADYDASGSAATVQGNLNTHIGLTGTSVHGLGTMSTQAASSVSITGGTIVGLTGLAIRDTSAAYDITISASSSVALTSGRTLTLDLTNAARTLQLTGDSVLNQDVSTTGTPTFGEATLTGMTGSVITTSNVKQSIEDLDISGSDQMQSGFTSWDASGPYWSSSGGDFTLLVSGVGYIHGKRFNWTAPQTIAIPAHTTPIVCIDNTGTIQQKPEDDLNTYKDNVALFLAFYDGTNMTVSKEYHHYGSPPRLINFNHQTFGSVFNGTGAVITQITTGTGGVVTDRELKIVGADTLWDMNLTTTVPDSGGSAVSWNWYYIDASGHWILYASQPDIPMVYDNAGTITTLGTSYGNFNLYAAKDNANSATPVYFGVIDNTIYANANQAATAISSGTLAFATNELEDLQIAHLGYITVKSNVSGGYITTVVVARSVHSSQLISSGSAASAALVTVNTSLFTHLFTSADTNVQTALNDLDTAWAAIPAGNLSGTIPTGVLGASSLYVGTTAIALNRASASQSLTGVTSIDGSASTLTTARAINGVNFDGSGDITVPVNNADDHTTNAAMYPIWTATQGGNYAAKTSFNLTFNPSTGTLSTTAISLPGTITAVGGSLTALGTLSLRDTSAAYNVRISADSSVALTAERNLSIDMVNTSSVLKMGANLTVVGASSINGTIGSMGYQAASAVAITGGTIAGLTGFGIRDTSAAHDVTIACTSSVALTAARTLTIDTLNVSSTLKIAQSSPNDATKYLDGTGAFSTPTATGLSVGPAFSVYLSAAQSLSLNTWTKVLYNTKILDTNSNYDNSTNYRFTPTVAGNYLISATVSLQNSVTDAVSFREVAIYKNGSIYKGSQIPYGNGGFYSTSVTVSDIIIANGTTDYFEIYAKFTAASGTPYIVTTLETDGTAANATFFFGSIIDIQGQHGSNWYTGAGAPSGLHDNGDFYLNTSNGDVYTQVSGSWGSPVANITGPQGAAGSLTGPGSSSDGGLMLFNGTGGNLAKQATGTGIAHITSGVYSASAVVESDITLADNTTNNLSITAHGFAPKAPNDTTKFLRGDATWAAPPGAIFSQSYTSTQQTITSAGSLTLAHGLGVMPTLFQVALVCQTAELHYSVGDVVVITEIGGFYGAQTGVAIVPDSTNLNIRFGANAGGGGGNGCFLLLDKTTGSANFITNANWKVVFRAWA
jgi:hypothetical protein